MHHRTFRSLVALVALIAFSGAAFAAPPARYWNDPYAAADHDKTLQRTLNGYERDGFTLQSVDEQPIYYLVTPTGTHAWGSFRYTLTRKVGGDYSLETDYVVVTAEVTWYDGLGYKVSRISIEETTVY